LINNIDTHTEAFASFDLAAGCLYDYRRNRFPTILYAWRAAELGLSSKGHSDTFFGYVHEGPAQLIAEHNRYELATGQYFSLAESISLRGGAGIVVRRLEYRCQNVVGGPIEEAGRLRYIDGCTDSLLIPPVQLGDPCLNALYFPPSVDQTTHTHPSMRVGMVARGRGECVTERGREDLYPGKIFIIHENGMHKFKTSAQDGMVVIAYHPDSDFGPRDVDHPMINRTMVGGVSAAALPGIQTLNQRA